MSLFHATLLVILQPVILQPYLFSFILGQHMKMKQIFYLLPAEVAGCVFIKSNLGRYLYAKEDGSWRGDSEVADRNAVWMIETQASGTWSFKSQHGFYANIQGDNLSCFTKVLPQDRSGEWVVHLAMHPQVNIMSCMRKRFLSCRFDAAKDPQGVNAQLQAVEDIPWGEDALMNFSFVTDHPDGRYSISAFTGGFLKADGKLTPDSSDPTSRFLLGFHDNAISLRDESGLYLSCTGGSGVMKANKNKITKDELFMLQDSEPQFTLEGWANAGLEIKTAADEKKSNTAKFVSIRSSLEVKSDQADVKDTERFQLEVSGSKVALKCNNGFYFSCTPDGTIAASAGKKTASELFTAEWCGRRVKFIAPNGKYVVIKPNGGLNAGGNSADPTGAFRLTLINRPVLLLRGQYGFVGIKGKSGRLEVNQSKGESYHLTAFDGAYQISEGPGAFWGYSPDGMTISANAATFTFEFTERSKFLIKHEADGKYLEGEQSGGFRATGTKSTPNTLWEY